MFFSTTEDEDQELFDQSFEHASGLIDPPVQPRSARRDRPAVIMIVHNPANPLSPCDQLISEARVAVPAVLNLLLFRPFPMAVMYFGKQFVDDGTKLGLDCAEDLKIRMLRFLMSEIWPPLLRTDLPDESSPAVGHAVSEKDWQRRSMEQGGMEVLLYLKQAQGGGKYLKLVLTNPQRRIHFDITSAKEEKYRWDNRMLHIRMLDNLETQKAVPSYDVYERYFNAACELSQTLASSSSSMDGERLLVPMTLTPVNRSYRYFESLEKPESSTLDYKSYFSNPMIELERKALKFMCGFLNALGTGKIVVGVYEMPRSKDSSLFGNALLAQSGLESPMALSNNSSNNSIVTHNMLVDQIVVGISVTDEQMEEFRCRLTEQLDDCVPPIPHCALSIESVPVVLPVRHLQPAQLLILHDTQRSGALESFRCKSNFSIRQLGRVNIALCPIELSHYPELESLIPVHTVAEQLYIMIPYSDEAAQLMKRPGWVDEILIAGLDKAKARGFHQAAQYEPGLTLPLLRVVEISVDRTKFPAAYGSYDGKFFCGWPSIPLWDPASSTIRSVERNFNIRSGVPKAPSAAPGWLAQPQVVSSIVDFLCGRLVSDRPALRALRLVHRLFNAEHEARIGTEVVTLLQRTPPGFAVLKASTHALGAMQALLRTGQNALIPLLLCRVYTLIGMLPSPYPYIAVPLAFQAIRVSSNLIPIYFLHSQCAGVLRIAVVLDKSDGIIKTVRWNDQGLRVIQPVVGVGFEKVEDNKPTLCREGRRFSSSVTPSSPTRSRSAAFVSGTHPNVLVRFAFLSAGRASTLHLYHDEPWTFQHLLVWLRVATHDPHVTPLPHTEQSFGFFCHPDELCSSHSRASSSRGTPESVMSPESSTIYPSSFDCVVHRAMAEWSNLALNSSR